MRVKRRQNSLNHLRVERTAWTRPLSTKQIVLKLSNVKEYLWAQDIATHPGPSYYSQSPNQHFHYELHPIVFYLSHHHSEMKQFKNFQQKSSEPTSYSTIVLSNELIPALARSPCLCPQRNPGDRRHAAPFVTHLFFPCGHLSAE